MGGRLGPATRRMQLRPGVLWALQWQHLQCSALRKRIPRAAVTGSGLRDVWLDRNSIGSYDMPPVAAICQFEHTSLPLIKECPVCGRRIGTPDPPEGILSVCRGERGKVVNAPDKKLIENAELAIYARQKAINKNLEPPDFVTRAKNFASAAAKWQAAGRPKCTDEQREQRFKICETCELFNGTHCTHSACGCPITRDSRWRNKLAWATEACPIGKWGAILPDATEGREQDAPTGNEDQEAGPA